MLVLSGLKPMSADRGPEAPLVIAGGPLTLNPEPLSGIIDAFVVGDGEAAVGEQSAQRFLVGDGAFLDQGEDGVVAGELGHGLVPRHYYARGGIIMRFLRGEVKSGGSAHFGAETLDVDSNSVRGGEPDNLLNTVFPLYVRVAPETLIKTLDNGVILHRH